MLSAVAVFHPPVTWSASSDISMKKARSNGTVDSVSWLGNRLSVRQVHCFLRLVFFPHVCSWQCYRVRVISASSDISMFSVDLLLIDYLLTIGNAGELWRHYLMYMCVCDVSFNLSHHGPCVIADVAPLTWTFTRNAMHSSQHTHHHLAYLFIVSSAALRLSPQHLKGYL